MFETVIKVENLSKQYRIGAHEGYKTFRETLTNAVKLPYRKISGLINQQSTINNRQSETIWALRNVSFEVKQGEVVGIIGRNGAGKSTLLKILAQITEPTEGRVELRGRVGSLLEVGTGFHPELTGHENVYLYGAILGMDRWEVTRKFDEIVAFAELEKFIDTPVKRYSSGMYMRLAFAVAAHLEPEILLVDEVLAVGDAAFQKKCLGKMDNVAKEGLTVLFVSHNMTAIQNLCKLGLVLKDGKIMFNGDANQAVVNYLDSVSRQEYGYADLSNHPGRLLGMQPIIRSVGLINSKGVDQYKNIVKTGEDVLIEIQYDCSDTALDYAFIGINSLFEGRVCSVGTHHSPNFNETMIGSGTLICCIPHLALSEGEYRILVAMGTKSPPRNIDCVENALQFRVELSDFFGSGVKLLHGQGHLVQRSQWQLMT